jgi:hypothetical protein
MSFRSVSRSLATAAALVLVHCASSSNLGPGEGNDSGPSGGSDDGAGSTSSDGGAIHNSDATIPRDGASEVPEGGTAPSCPVSSADAGGPSTTLLSGGGAGPSGSIPITVDGTGTGRTFDGIGAISGGGGNTRLFYDYPEPYRSQVLDYLFTPGVGAALHILKVEIGGDMNSTDGSEESHMHTASDLDCGRGYEWWLMEQAKARNPSIKLYGLSWGAPGWIGGGNFWSQDMVNYLLKWLGCAKSNGLSIDYLGGWNERSYDKSWYESLHTALAASAYSSVKVVGADDSWAIATDMASDSTFKAAVDIVGVHYPCGGDGSSATSCPANADGLGRGVPLWASENGSQDLNTGAPAMIRAIVRGYDEAQMTAYINWPILAAIPPNIPWETMGLVQANNPWSGWYEVGLQTWTTAQVTQFTQPGWSFIDSASAYLGGTNTNGGYIALKSPNGTDYTIILETTTATAPQTAAFTIQGGLSTGEVHVWTTNLGSGSQADYFVHAGDVTPQGGVYWVTLPPNTITTLSTIGGQGKGAAQPPSPLAPVLPYADAFESEAIGALAPTIADQSGAFEVAACTGGRTGQCLRQMAPVVPVEWNSDEQPYNTIGTNDWADYTIGVDVMLESAGSVEVIGRFSGRDYGQIAHLDGYFFSVSDTGAWSIVEANQSGTLQTALASGTVAALGTMAWHHLDFSLTGVTITASIDGTIVGNVTDTTYAVGPAGLAVGLVSANWFNAQFDNLSIKPNGPLATANTNMLVNRASGLVLDVTGQSTASGAALEEAAPSGQASQGWQFTGDRSGATVLLNEGSLLAMSAAGGGLDQEPFDGGAAQHWTLEPTGDAFYRVISSGGTALQGAASGSAVSLAPLDCTANAQEWSVAAAPTNGATYTIKNHKTGWLVDINQASTSPGALAIQWPSNGGSNQEWRLGFVAGGGILTNANSNLVLGVGSSGADQETPAGTASQTWTLGAAVSAGYYTIASVGGAGVLTSPSSSQGDQLTVTPPASGDPSQEWMLASPF